MSLAGPIARTLSGGPKTADLTASRLASAWLMAENHGRSATGSGPLCRSHERLADLPDDQPVLAVVSPEASETESLLERALRGGTRAYVLAPSAWTPPTWMQELPSTRALFRRVDSPPFALVLGGNHGWLWSGASGPGAWRLKLDDEQASDARLAFLRLFWHHATQEAWPAGGKFEWHGVPTAPFDVPLPKEDARIHLFPAPLKPEILPEDELVYSPLEITTRSAPSRLWVQPSGHGHDRLKALADRGSAIVWSELGLPFAACGASSRMICCTEKWCAEVRLNPHQDRTLRELLRSGESCTFVADVPLAEAHERVGLKGQVWLPGIPMPDCLRKQDELDAGLIAATALREVASVQPPSWPEPHALALSAHWTWTVKVPGVPNGSKTDPLVKNWEQLDQAFSKRVSAGLSVLEEIEKKEGLVGKTFEALKGAVLGFGRTRTGLLAELKKLGEQTPSILGRQEARATLIRLGDLENRIADLGSNLTKAEQVEQEKVERARQEAEHRRSCDAAHKERRELEVELQKANEELEGVEKQLGEVGTAGLDKKDRKPRQKKLRDERERLEKRTRHLQQEIERRKAIVEKPFEFRPRAIAAPVGKKLSFVPSAAGRGPDQVPHDGLPSVGRLLLAGKERILAIVTWEELDQGEMDAARLRARLVADVEGA